MKQVDIVIHNPTGLHARPAKEFVNIAKKFKSDIRVVHGSKKANAKSMISMLTLGVEYGGEICIMVDGEDEDEALAALETAVKAGLGEGEAEAHAPAPPPHQNPQKNQRPPRMTCQRMYSKASRLPLASPLGRYTAYNTKRSKLKNHSRA